MQSSTEPARPWLAQYPPDISPEPSVLLEHGTLVAAWAARCHAAPDRAALRYFDGAVTAAELDAVSDALAAALQDRGVAKGDRVGVRLQNVPHFPIAMLALWKIGAAVLLVNPMYQKRELRQLVDDSGAVGLIVDEHGLAEATETVEGSTVSWLLSSSSLDHQTRNDERVFADASRVETDADIAALVEQFADRRPEPVDVGPDDVALLTYTSGTTGPPKGAMNTHANVLAVAGSYASWVALAPGDVVLAIAPIFHITGAVINATLALLHDTTLVLVGRFRPDVVLDAFAEHGVTFTIGSITAFNALAAVPHADRGHFESVRYLYSGGAPIPPATIERFQERFGHYIHNVYGMTETSSGVVAVPRERQAPVHEASGTLSVGVPLPGTFARIVDPEGEDVPYGEQGELELSGPAVVPGYWNNPEETERTMPGGRLRTGDGAIMDEDGYVFLVDRLKDQINVSGYKVWPREVEDVLYEHDAVHEAAVVGRSDDYKGEIVIAFVSLEEGATVEPAELVAFVRERLAAYKCPQEVVIIDDLPKTQTGKIRRKELRDDLAAS